MYPSQPPFPKGEKKKLENRGKGKKILKTLIPKGVTQKGKGENPNKAEKEKRGPIKPPIGKEKS